MKSRSKELLDRAIAATTAAIEIYNKPNFPYREETFAVLAINGWELLFKAKWLADNKNKVASLYVMDEVPKLDGSKSKRLKVRLTRSGNPFTHSLDFIAKKLINAKQFDESGWANLQALLEIRDSSVHFCNLSGAFSQRLQEIGAASVKNFVAATKAWFSRDLAQLNFTLLPMSFITLTDHESLVLNHEEKRFLAFINGLESKAPKTESPYAVTVNIDIKFTRSKAKDALGVQITNNLDAPEVRLTEEQIRESYPWDYDRLTDACRERYKDFKVTNDYHVLRKKLQSDKRFGAIRFLDPGNSKSAKKPFFNPNIITELDKHYVKK